MLIKPIFMLSAALCSLLLSGCVSTEPTQFDMPQSQFQGLSKDQQNQVISAYNQRRQTNTDSAAYDGAINSAANLVSAVKARSQPASLAVAPTLPSASDAWTCSNLNWSNQSAAASCGAPSCMNNTVTANCRQANGLPHYNAQLDLSNCNYTTNTISNCDGHLTCGVC